MKKFEKGKRFLTFLLVALMVVQQSSVTTLAEELAEYTQEAQNQDTEAVAEVSEASEPEASVPDSDKAQEQQPAAEEPAAPAEQETAEVTEAPQATEAPAQETAPTEAPAQEAEQTEAPQENAAVTETPQATEAPVVTEAPAETATKAQFSGAVDNATANVTLSQPISDKAVFVAKQYSVDSDYFANNAEAAVSQWVANNGLTVLDATAYDMHFEENGQEIAVNQSANVSLSFNSPILTMTGDAGVPSNIYVLHIVNGQAVAAGSASQDGNGAVVAANITTEGFSPFVFVKAVSGDAVEPTDIDLSQEFSLADYVESLSIQIKIGEDAYKPDKEYKITQAFNFAADYVLDDNKLKALKQELKNNPNVENITFSYTVPDSITGFKTVQNEDLKNSSNQIIGKYDISDGKVTLRFNRDFFLKDHISGNFRYYFHAAQDKVDENSNLNISFPGTSTTTTIKIEKPNLNISKSHEIKDGKIIFKIKVPKRDRDCKNVQITDVPGSNLAINPDSIKSNGNSAGVSSLNENGGFTLNLGDLKAGDEVEITYEASIIDETRVGNNGGIEGLDNTVNWTATGTDSGSKTDWVWASVKTGSKSVQNDGTNKQKLNWTVSLNNGEIKADMSGKTYEDTMTSNPDNQVFLHDTLKIKTKDGTDITNKCTVSWNNDGKHFTVIFPNSEILGADAKKEFEITYTTEPQTPLAENATVSVTNNGKLDKKDVNGATGTSQNPGKEDQLTKEAVSYENDVFTWTATFTPGSSVTNPVFYDILANAGNFDASTETWGWKNGYTNSVFLEDAVDLQITYDGKPLNVNDYAVSYSKVNVSEDMVGNDAMKIQFHGNFDKPITITYKSQGMGTPGSKYQVANSCHMGTKEARAYREFTIKNNIVKYGWSNDENGKKYLYWTIYANTPDLNNSENCLEGDMDLEGATANIVDTLPEGLKFVSATYKKWGSSAEKNTPEQNIEPVQDKDGQKLTFSIPDVRKQIIKITVKTAMERFVSSSDNANHAVYVNNVSWNADGTESLGEAKAEQKIDSTILKKDGKVTGNDTVTYTIKVNQDGRKLLKNGTKLILQDKLPTNVTFGSIEITNKDKSEKLNGASYSIEDGVLTISIPDETPAIVTYTVNPVLTGIKADANGNYHIKIENSVSLKGEENVKSSVNKEYKLQGHSASADADRHSIIIEKKDSSEPTKKLQGAKFSLKKITFIDGTAHDEEVASAETDDKGSITFGNLEFDTVYSYQETEAPEGYAKSRQNSLLLH